METKENKENNKSRQRMFLVVFLVILQAVIGITYSFNSDKVNNNLRWHKKYYEAVDNILSEDFVTASAQLYFVYDELGDYRNTKYFYDFCEACEYYKCDNYIKAQETLPDYNPNYVLTSKQRKIVDEWTSKIRSKYEYAIELPTTTIPFEKAYSKYVSQYRSTSHSGEYEYTTTKRSTGAKGSSSYPRPSRYSSSGSGNKTTKKKQLINILQKEPRQKRQQQRNTIHMMRLIIIIPKIFITIITTISLTTMKRKIIFTNIINQNQIESTYKECVRDKLDDRTTTCLTVRCQCLNDGLYITPVVPTGVFYALFIVEIIILKEIFYENT